MAIAAAAGIVSYCNADPGRDGWFRVGLAAGTMAFPLVSAWLVSTLWRHPVAPVVVAAVISALSIAGTGTASIKARAATEQYTRRLEARIEQWAGQRRAWQAMDIAAPAKLASAEELQAAIARANELERAARDLLAEVEDGDAYREALSAHGLSESEAQAAWGQVSFSPLFERLRERLRVAADLLRVTAELSTALRDRLGHWRRDADGRLHFDAEVDATHADFIAVRQRRCEQLRARLRELAGG